MTHYQKAPILPWQTPWLPAPRLPLSWLLAVVVALALAFASGVIVGTLADNVITELRAPPAAPANQPVAPILAPAQPTMPPTPTATPAVAPTAEPTRAPLPLIEVEWTLVEGAPVAHALFVKDGILCAVQDTAGGKITRCRNNDGMWSAAQRATDEEANLVIDQNWDQTPILENLFLEILGGPPEWATSNWGGRPRVGFPPYYTVGLDTAEHKDFLYLYDNGRWVEIVPPPEMKGILYGFARLDDTLFVSGWRPEQHDLVVRLWQAQLESPSP